MNTVTGCLNAGDFSQALSVTGAVFPQGNQPLLDAIQQCMDLQNQLSIAVQAALSLAEGQ